MNHCAVAIAPLAVVLALSASPAAAQETHLLVVSGLGGEESYSQTFQEWAAQLVDAAAEAGVRSENICFLAENADADADRIDGQSTKENIEAALGALTETVSPDDQVWIVIIGHGSAGSDGEARINLPGPDMSVHDFARHLDALATEAVAFVNTASASGGFLPGIAGDRRAVVTATKSARQSNETVFGGYFAEAFVGGAADANKDGRVSLLEAFDYSRHEVSRYYEQANLMATEHALLDDDGDGEGSTSPSLLPGEGESNDGRLAGRIYLGRSREEIAAGDSEELQALFAEKRRVEARIDVLRTQKSSLPEELYLRELEVLAVELALLDRRIRQSSPEPMPESGQEDVPTETLEEPPKQNQHGRGEP